MRQSYVGNVSVNPSQKRQLWLLIEQRRVTCLSIRSSSRSSYLPSWCVAIVDIFHFSLPCCDDQKEKIFRMTGFVFQGFIFSWSNPLIAYHLSSSLFCPCCACHSWQIYLFLSRKYRPEVLPLYQSALNLLFIIIREKRVLSLSYFFTNIRTTFQTTLMEFMSY